MTADRPKERPRRRWRASRPKTLREKGTTMDASTKTGQFVAHQGTHAPAVVERAPAVGLIMHAHGTLRLFLDPAGQLVAEVVGMETPAARRFLESLDDLADVTSEILVCDRPDEYTLDARPIRDRHVRRRS